MIFRNKWEIPIEEIFGRKENRGQKVITQTNDNQKNEIENLEQKTQNNDPNFDEKSSN